VIRFRESAEDELTEFVVDSAQMSRPRLIWWTTAIGAVTSSNLSIAQLHEGFGGQKFLNMCVHNALNCEFVFIFICIAI